MATLKQKLAIKYRIETYGEDPRKDHTSAHVETAFQAGYQRLYALIDDFAKRFLPPEQQRAIREWDKEHED